MASITEKTLIPISLVLTIIGGVVWLTTLWARTEAHANEISDLKSDVRAVAIEVRENNKEVMKKLIELEVKLSK